MSLTDIKARILALFDTPEQQLSEEQAELVKWQAMRATHDALGDAWDEVDDLIDELIEAEATHVAGSAEDAETEVEAAKLDAIRMHLYSMSGSISAMISAAYPVPSPAPARYMEQFKALYGKTISAASMKKVQSAHDASHDMHSHTVALGAECNGMKLLASKMMDCETCDGTGQVKDGENQKDCPACKGEGQIKAAEAHDADGNGAEGELKAACRCEEAEMDKKTRIAALLGHEPIKAWATEATLNALDEKQLETLEAQCTKQQADLKTAQDAKDAAVAAEVKAKADLKAASEHVPTEEEYLKTAPESIRTLVAEKKQQDATEKADLVTKLVAASKAKTKEQLEAMPIDDLRTLAAFAKVETVDFSIKGVPVPRAASSSESYTPPSPYEKGLKALQAVN